MEWPRNKHGINASCTELAVIIVQHFINRIDMNGIESELLVVGDVVLYVVGAVRLGEVRRAEGQCEYTPVL